MSFPKILIVGQAFNTSSGGGITLTNLYKGWPEDKIAVAAYGLQSLDVSTEICTRYYQLGQDEYRWIFPLNLFLPEFKSGETQISVKSDVAPADYNNRFHVLSIRKYFTRLVRWSGLIFCGARINISERFRVWLSIYKPDFLYIQVSTRQGIRLATDLCNYLNVPSAIHMMDDWPSTITRKGLFRTYWKTKIDREFRQLLDIVDLHLSISDAMSKEYKVRYEKDFTSFHNPVDLDLWQKYSKRGIEIDENNISILYAGRIGNGICHSLFEVASIIDYMRSKGQNIKFYIQTPTANLEIINKLRKFHCIVINPSVEYCEMPKIFSSADILLLANDFNKKANEFLKFSMPTKVTEYLISGTPILLYAPEDNAISKFFLENECGCCVTNHDHDELLKALNYLIQDKEFRAKISANALKIVKGKFDSKIIRSNFNDLIRNVPAGKSKN